VIVNGDGTQTTHYENIAANAAIAALATLVGGAAGALLGTDATSAALAAQNEVLNNALSGKQTKLRDDQIATTKTAADKQALASKWDNVDQAQTKVYADLTDAKDAYALALTPADKAAAYLKLQHAVAQASSLYDTFRANGDSGGMGILGRALLGASMSMQQASTELDKPLELTAQQREALAQTYMQVGTALSAAEGSMASGNTNLAKGVQSLVDFVGGAGVPVGSGTLPKPTAESGPYSQAQGGSPSTVVKAGPGYTAADVLPGVPTVDQAAIGLQWGKGIQGQGMPWEAYLAGQLPAGSQLPPNFNTFDFFDAETGVATSAKTLNTTTTAKVANPSQVYNSLKGNIDAAANFEKAALSGQQLTSSMITAREISVAVPSGTTPAQWDQISKAIQYGQGKGVAVKITIVKP
jgi:filamentous hemagglutinin